MVGTHEQVTLPKFVIASELSRIFRGKEPDELFGASDTIDFDWSDVLFFDDYTLLKLIFLQRHLRLLGRRVRNIGFVYAAINPNRQAVLRQLWAVGLPELTASGYLIGTEQLKDALKGESQLLESNPILGLQSPAAMTSVIPMLCCHDLKHFAAGSREEKQLDSFIRTGLRPSGQKFLAWDLVESRDFRHLMLQQLRRNVQEHSRSESEAAIGIAIVRVWTYQSLSDEWGLTEDTKAQLLQLWRQEPLPSIFQELHDNRGILQISVLDNGVGIPCKLTDVYKGLLKSGVQQKFFRLQSGIKDFDKRFEGPASWSDEKARLLAFATDLLGTSKPDRPAEIKGLEYLRKSAVIDRSGAACIESDGAAISHFTRNQPYGQPCQLRLTWCKTGGTGICLAVPMSPVKSSGDIRKLVPHAVELITSDYPGSLAERINVKDQLIPRPSSSKPSEIKPKEIVSCGKVILGMIRQPDVEADRTLLRPKKLLIVDFGELPESKDIFHYLFVEIAKGLAEINARQMRPFVFANLPKGLCGLVGQAINMYSKLAKHPVLAFTAEQVEPFWMGLDDENCISVDLRRKVSCEIRRKITDHKENCTEAFYRDCLTHLLSNEKPVPLFDGSVLDCVDFDNRSDIRDSPAFSRLDALVRRCALFREERRRSFTEDEMVYTARFQPVFQIGEIEAEVRELFLDKFRDVFTRPPVCFKPKNEREGVLLPHSRRISAQYFRSDALVDSPIAAELTQELISIALGIAKQQPSGRIDWVVSCTSPLHWFVHRMVDGLAEYGMNCSHHVFPSYEDIPSSIEDIPMRPNETVLGFTDIIASGQTAFRMAESLANHFGVRMVGLLALADIRTSKEHKSGPDILKVYDGRIVCLYNKPEPYRQDLNPAYYVHPETVVPKRKTKTDPMDEFFDRNYSGTGPLVEKHAYFSSAMRTLDLMKSLGAVRFGHFQHGSHHSEIFVDVEKILLCSEYRNLMVTAIFRYIIDHDIRLVLYPSHSSAYMLADDLKQRCESAPVEFIMACRTFRGIQGTSYALTRFSPHPEPQWKQFSSNAVLILDDAVCTGETVKSIIAELARIDRNYYDDQTLPHPGLSESLFSVHVVAFLNRLPRITGDFWRGLSWVAAGRVQFSAFISMPLAADSEELCPQCRLEKKLGHEKDSAMYCLYAKEFLSWWISNSTLLYSHERRHLDSKRGEHFSSEEALRLAGYLSAIERHAYQSVSENLFDKPGKSAEETSISVRIHVRSRAGFLHDLFPVADKAEDRVVIQCKELASLIDMTMDENGSLELQDDALGILQTLTLRYLRMRPTPDEVERVMECLLMKFAREFDNRLVVGSIASVLDSCRKWFGLQEHKELCNRLRGSINKVLQVDLTKKARLMIDWFDMYLVEGEKKIDSVGEAVKMLSEFAKKGRSNHFYGRHELDELRDIFRRPPDQVEADQAPEAIRRTLVCTDRFIELVRATRVLQSACIMDERELKKLQDKTERDALELRKLCNNLLREDNTEDDIENYKKVKSLFLTTYNRWFPSGELDRPMAATVIAYFTPNLYDFFESAWGNFAPQRRTKEAIQMDMTDLLRHKSMKVLVDPRVLTTAINQLLDNIDKHAEQGAAVRVFCRICSSEDESQAADVIPKIASEQVGVVVSNNNTPRLEPAQIKLRGLSAVKMRLSEYGGDFYYTVPENNFSFQATMILPVWTEAQK